MLQEISQKEVRGIAKNISINLENTYVVLNRMLVEVSTLQGSESNEEHISAAGENVILF